MKNYHETDLQLAFCKWVNANYPEDTFVRHEREQKRTPYMQNLFSIMNKGIDKLPDFEAFIGNGFYIEFKAPGKKWLQRDGKTVKKEYANQYRNHLILWSMGRCVWFCNDLEDAKKLYFDFKDGYMHGRQDYLLPTSQEDINNAIADEFFNRMG